MSGSAARRRDNISNLRLHNIEKPENELRSDHVQAKGPHQKSCTGQSQCDSAVGGHFSRGEGVIIIIWDWAVCGANQLTARSARRRTLLANPVLRVLLSASPHVYLQKAPNQKKSPIRRSASSLGALYGSTPNDRSNDVRSRSSFEIVRTSSNDVCKRSVQPRVWAVWRGG